MSEEVKSGDVSEEVKSGEVSEEEVKCGEVAEDLIRCVRRRKVDEESGMWRLSTVGWGGG